MIADCFMKPLQGSLFVKLLNYIMGAEYGGGHPQTHRSVLEEADGKADDNSVLDVKAEQEIDDNNEATEQQTVGDETLKLVGGGGGGGHQKWSMGEYTWEKLRKAAIYIMNT